MAITTALITAKVMHARQRPRRHIFTYGVYYLCFALSEMSKLRGPLLSLERWNLLSFYRRDHGPRDGGDLDVWMRGILTAHGLDMANGDIILLTLPRILGYVFNPVSFWFCLDREGGLRAVLSEVSNTFGEHHSYLSYHDDRRIIGPGDRLRAEKLFHVSPFMDIEGHYLFRFTCNDAKVVAEVDYFDAQGLMLATSVSGCPRPLTARNIIAAFFKFPLVTFKVVALIHWQAIRIILKGVRYRSKPLPPTQEVTR